MTESGLWKSVKVDAQTVTDDRHKAVKPDLLRLHAQKKMRMD